MSDERELAEAVGRLSTENKKLKDELDACKKNLKQLKMIRTFGNYFDPQMLWFVPVTLICLLICYPIYKAITAENILHHCNISFSDKKYNLYGIVEWKPDNLRLGEFDDLDSTIKAAEKLKCPLQLQNK